MADESTSKIKNNYPVPGSPGHYAIDEALKIEKGNNNNLNTPLESEPNTNKYGIGLNSGLDPDTFNPATKKYNFFKTYNTVLTSPNIFNPDYDVRYVGDEGATGINNRYIKGYKDKIGYVNKLIKEKSGRNATNLIEQSPAKRNTKPSSP